MAYKPWSRRTFLRGSGGAILGLPLLDIMLGPHGEAMAGGEAMATHFFVGFVGQSMGADNDPLHNDYAPDAFGADYATKTASAPLENYGAVKNDVSIISNLRIPYGEDIPAGGWRSDFHTQALGPLICGVRNEFGNEYEVQGVTADQVVADAIGAGTTFPGGLQYQVQASWYLTNSAPYGRDVLSYKRDGGGALVPNPGQTSPQAAWQALFTGFIPPDPGDASAALRDLEKRRSVLDRVMSHMDTLRPQLGMADRARLDRHFEEVRDLELRLSATPPDQTLECMMLPDPGPDSPVGGNNNEASGDGFDINAGWSDESERARIFSDLVHMAFTCDLSRSVAMLYTMAQSHMNIHPINEFAYDQHELGHSGNGTVAVNEVIAWHVDHFAYLVAKLRDTPEGGGSVLDNSAMVLLHEGGHGFDPGSGSENSTHSTENMIVLAAGGAGGMVGGLHIDGRDAHPCNVLNTAMRAVGVEQDLGEVVGTIPELLP